MVKKFKEVLERAIFLVIGVIIALVLLGGRGPEPTFASPQPQGLLENVLACTDGTKLKTPDNTFSCASDEVLVVLLTFQRYQEVLARLTAVEEVVGPMDDRLTATEEIVGPMDDRLTTVEEAVIAMWKGWDDIFSGAALELDGLVDNIVGPMD